MDHSEQKRLSLPKVIHYRWGRGEGGRGEGGGGGGKGGGGKGGGGRVEKGGGNHSLMHFYTWIFLF